MDYILDFLEIEEMSVSWTNLISGALVTEIWKNLVKYSERKTSWD